MEKGNRRNRRNRPKCKEGSFCDKNKHTTHTDTDRLFSAQSWGYHFRGPPEQNLLKRKQVQELSKGRLTSPTPQTRCAERAARRRRADGARPRPGAHRDGRAALARSVVGSLLYRVCAVRREPGPRWSGAGRVARPPRVTLLLARVLKR